MDVDAGKKDETQMYKPETHSESADGTFAHVHQQTQQTQRIVKITQEGNEIIALYGNVKDRRKNLIHSIQACY